MFIQKELKQEFKNLKKARYVAMEIKADNFTVNLYRAEESSHKKEIKSLANYVYTICKLGKQQELKNVVDKVAIATENREENDRSTTQI